MTTNDTPAVETVTDRAAIRDSDEPEEFPCCRPDPATVAALDLDAVERDALHGIRPGIAATLTLFAEIERARAEADRLREQLQHECPHGEMSWSGADQTDLDDAAKVWVCDNCGKSLQPEEQAELKTSRETVAALQAEVERWREGRDTPEQVEAVDALARIAFMAFHDQACPEGRHCEARNLHAQVYGWVDGRKMIDALLSPENAPTVLAALTEAGHLSEERTFTYEGEGGRIMHAGFGLAGGVQPKRRLVTPWEVAP